MQQPPDDDFVDPIPQRLPLSGGQFVDIKRELTHGESEDMYAVIQPHGVDDRRVVRTARINAYLLSWSLTKKGIPVPMSPEMTQKDRLDTIRALSPYRAKEIYDAIVAHEIKLFTARVEAQKKTRSGVPDVAPISPSPSGPGGSSAPASSDASAQTTTPTSPHSSPRLKAATSK